MCFSGSLLEEKTGLTGFVVFASFLAGWIWQRHFSSSCVWKAIWSLPRSSSSTAPFRRSCFTARIVPPENRIYEKRYHYKTGEQQTCNGQQNYLLLCKNLHPSMNNYIFCEFYRKCIVAKQIIYVFLNYCFLCKPSSNMFLIKQANLRIG